MVWPSMTMIERAKYRSWVGVHQSMASSCCCCTTTTTLLILQYFLLILVDTLFGVAVTLSNLSQSLWKPKKFVFPSTSSCWKNAFFFSSLTGAQEIVKKLYKRLCDLRANIPQGIKKHQSEFWRIKGFLGKTCSSFYHIRTWLKALHSGLLCPFLSHSSKVIFLAITVVKNWH